MAGDERCPHATSRIGVNRPVLCSERKVTSGDKYNLRPCTSSDYTMCTTYKISRATAAFSGLAQELRESRFPQF